MGRTGIFVSAVASLEREASGAGRRPDARRQRIARIHRQIHHASALHAVTRPHRSVRKHRSHRVTVVSRIRIDQTADRAVLGGEFRLDAAPRLSVPGDDDGAADRDAEAIEELVVFSPAVVDVDQRRRDVAVDRVGVVAGKLFRLLSRCRIAGNGRFLEFRRELRRLDQLQPAFHRRREEHVEALDLGAPAPLLEPRENPFGVVLAVGRPDVVRPRAQALHRALDVGGLRQGAERFVPVSGGRRLRERRSRHDAP